MPEAKKSNAEFLKWFKPVLDALKELGGTATPAKVREQIINDLHLTDAIVNETYGKSNTNKFANQVAFARNYLVYAGYIDKSQSGIWSLTESGKSVEMTDELASDIFVTNAPKHVSKEKTHLSWIPFYEEYADVLLKYKNDRQSLIQKLKMVFTNINIPFPKLESDYSVIDIDPFTAFGFFNKQISDENRIKILESIKNVFEVKEEVPTDFDAIPVVNNLKAAFFYGLKNREKNNDIDNLWEIFDQALKFDKNNTELFEELYSTCLTQQGIKWNLSMGLFWIRPNIFIPLDANTRNLIFSKYNILIKKPIDGKEYIELINKLKIDNIPEFSHGAWKDKKNTVENTIDDSFVHYWLYAPGEKASKWDEFYKKGIMGLGWDEISDIREFDSRDEIKAKLKEIHGESSAEINSSLALWEFANLMKPGDIIFVKKGMYKVLGRGIVDSDYYYDENGKGYPHLRKVKWTHNEVHDHPGQAVMKTLTDITDYTEYVGKLNSLFEVEDEQSEIKNEYEPYDADSFFNEVFISQEKYETIVNLLERKKNIILQGAPGVGKSFAARRLAYSIIGEKNDTQVKLVQFHQSYSYEDFIVGFRPSEKENKQFEKKYGVFYEFCKKAIDDSDNKYFFIIDEINRGNMSKIFGELLLLIESDKRGSKNKIQLLYSNEDFYVPENLYIIGMMNTADRSLAMIDYALRRRFAFVEFEPAFESAGFKQKQNEISNEKYNRLIDCVEDLNEKIISDVSLGKGFRIGHSYFIPKNVSDVDDGWLSDVVHYELIPLLEEYWFDETDTLSEWKRKLEDSIR
ncbi:MAG: AAA family ATPase [Treponema sp.]|nr:AAA family ATPase [Treponema sp.]